MSVAPAVLAAVREHLIALDAAPEPAAVLAALRAQGEVMSAAGLATLVTDLRAELAGAGPLEPLLIEPGITDVLVNGPREVWCDRGAGLERSGIHFVDEASVRRLAQRLAMRAGRRLDEAAPFVDAQLPSGVRLHAVIPPIAEATHISLRVPGSRHLSLGDLLRQGGLGEPARWWLTALIRARVSLLITGGTGSGKTTLLSALLGCVGPGERIVIVEDAPELNPSHDHVVRLCGRPPNVEGAGAVTLTDLCRQALRMRPDRLIVGEVRGREVIDLLTALNTGHEGGAATVHANSAADAPARIAALALAAGLDRPAAHTYLLTGVGAIVHVLRTRQGDGTILRRPHGIDVLVAGATPDCAEVLPAVRFLPHTSVGGESRDGMTGAVAAGAVGAGAPGEAAAGDGAAGVDRLLTEAGDPPAIRRGPGFTRLLTLLGSP